MNTKDAYAINADGIIHHFPNVTLNRGCTQTRRFAEESKSLVDNGGISLVIDSAVSKDVLKSAIEILRSKLQSISTITCIETGKRYCELAPDETIQLHNAYVACDNKPGFGILEITNPDDYFIGKQPQSFLYFQGLTFLRLIP